jgi:hypothetical protein
MKDICNNLKELYEKLKELNNLDNDLDISQSNEDDDEAYICFEQKIIHYNDGFFDISCLYGEHQTFKFGSIDEVLQFYEGYSNFLGFKYDYKKHDDKLKIAYNIGYYCMFKPVIEEYVNLIIPKYLNEKQHDWKI